MAAPRRRVPPKGAPKRLVSPILKRRFIEPEKPMAAPKTAPKRSADPKVTPRFKPVETPKASKPRVTPRYASPSDSLKQAAGRMGVEKQLQSLERRAKSGAPVRDQMAGAAKAMAEGPKPSTVGRRTTRAR